MQCLNSHTVSALLGRAAVQASAAIVLTLSVASIHAGKIQGIEALERGDEETAIKELTPLAEGGDVDAQYALGALCDDHKDYAKARQWYQLAVEKGDSDAQNNLAWLYLLGNGVPRDPDRALQLFNSAATQNNLSAFRSLAKVYTKGVGVPPDPTAAFKWWRKAAEQDDPTSQFRVGLAYLDGVGVEQDSAQGVAWLEKSANAGEGPAQANLGELYGSGTYVPKDSTKGCFWLTLSTQSLNRRGERFGSTPALSSFLQRTEDSKNEVCSALSRQQLAKVEVDASNWKPDRRHEERELRKLKELKEKWRSESDSWAQ